MTFVLYRYLYIRTKDCLKEIYLFVDLGTFAIDSKNPPHTHTHRALWLEGREKREAERHSCVRFVDFHGPWTHSVREEEGIRSPAGRHDFQIPTLAQVKKQLP